MVPARTMEKHLLLAAFEQCAPGAIMLRALGASPERLRILAQGTPVSKNGVPGDFSSDWDDLDWMILHGESLGAQLLQELGVSRVAAAAWIARE